MEQIRHEKYRLIRQIVLKKGLNQTHFLKLQSRTTG